MISSPLTTLSHMDGSRRDLYTTTENLPIPNTCTEKKQSNKKDSVGLAETAMYNIDELAYKRELPIVAQNRPFLLKEMERNLTYMILKCISFLKQSWVLFPVTNNHSPSEGLTNKKKGIKEYFILMKGKC